MVSAVLLLVLGRVMGLRVSEETERVGLDLSEHDESVVPAYDRPAVVAGANGPVLSDSKPAKEGSGRVEATAVYLPQQAGPASLDPLYGNA